MSVVGSTNFSTSADIQPVYATSNARNDSSYQSEFMTTNNRALHARSTSTQQLPTTYYSSTEGTTFVTNGVTLGSRLFTHRESLLTHMGEIIPETTTVQVETTTQNERSAIRWGQTFNNFIHSTTNSNNSNRLGGGEAGGAGMPFRDSRFVYPSVNINRGNLSSDSFIFRASETRRRSGDLTAFMPFHSSTDYRTGTSSQSLVPLRFEHLDNRFNRSSDLDIPYTHNFESQEQKQEGKDRLYNGDILPSFLQHRGGLISHPRHFDPYAQAPLMNCRREPQATVFSSVPSRTVVHPALPTNSHTGRTAGISIGEGQACQHQQHPSCQYPTWPLPPPPPPPPPPQTRQLPRLSTFFLENATEATQHAIVSQARRAQRRHETSLFEFFERLGHRQRRQQQQQRYYHHRPLGTVLPWEIGRNRPERGSSIRNRNHNAWRRIDFASPMSTLTFIHPRPRTPPPPAPLTREMDATRPQFRLPANSNMRRFSESYLLEAAFAPDVDNMSYEELLDLAECIGRVERGVPHERLRQLRVVMQPMHFKSRSSSSEKTEVKSSLKTDNEDSVSCCVCLDSFSVGQLAIRLPCCRHFLHEGCASRWFEGHFRCPICTRDVRNTEF